MPSEISTKFREAVSAVCANVSVASFSPMANTEFDFIQSKWPYSTFVRRADTGAYRLDFGAATDQLKTATIAAAEVFDPVVAQAQIDAEKQRIANLAANSGVTDMLDRINSATGAQIDTWLTANVTNLAQARTVLGVIIKFIAARLR